MKNLIIILFCVVTTHSYSQSWKKFRPTELGVEYSYCAAYMKVDEADNSIWFGTTGYLKQFKNGEITTFKDIGEDISSNHFNFVRDIVIINSEIYGIDQVHGLFKYSNGTTTMESTNIVSGHTIEKSQDDSLWIGLDQSTASTQSVYGYKNGNYLFYNHINSGCFTQYVYQVFPDSYGRIWCANWNPEYNIGAGYSVRDAQGNWDSLLFDLDGLNTYRIKKFAQDNFGNIWCATRQGLGLYNEVTKTWTSYDKSNTNLPSEFISDLTFDNNGRMWVYLQDTAIAYSYNATDWTIYDNTNCPIDFDDVWSGMQLEIDTLGNLWTNDGCTFYAFNPDGYDNTWLSDGATATIDVNISVYPNPASKTIYVNGTGLNADYILYNITGQQQNIKANNNHQIDISHLTSGTYFLHIKTDAQTVIKKVMIE